MERATKIWEREELRLCCDVVYPDCAMCPLLECCQRDKNKKMVLWNEKTERFDIYIYKDGKLVNSWSEE